MLTNLLLDADVGDSNNKIHYSDHRLFNTCKLIHIPDTDFTSYIAKLQG